MRSVKSEYNFGLLHCRLASRCKGVTLVELIVAFSLIVIIFAAIVPQFRAIRISWAGAEAAASIIQNGRVLSEHITRNLSAANKVISVSLASQVQGYITFADANDDNYRYMYSNGYVVFGPVGSEEQLAGPVGRFQITCYLIYPSLAATTDANDIRYIEIETDFTNSDPLGTDKTFTTGVLLRTNADDGCGIVARWRLDETSGTTAADLVGGYNGTLYNGPIWRPTGGRIGGALEFDGNNDRVDLPIGPLVNFLEDCTVTAWVRWDGTGGFWQRVWDFGTGTTYNMFLTVNNGDTSTATPRFAITTSGKAGEERLTAPNSLPADTWCHLAVTIDSGAHTHKLYVDGELVDENTSAYLTPGNLGNTGNNYLARSNYSTDDYFEGRIDDVRIYNRALDADEIIQLANTLRFRSFEAAKTLSDTTSLTIATPNDVNENDLLIAAVAVDEDVSSSLAGGGDWTVINIDDYTSSAETPDVTHDNSGRQCLIGFVVNKEPSSDAVGIIGSWDYSAAPHSHLEETGGTNRALLFFVHAEPSSNPSSSFNNVSYGGQPMTKIIDRHGGSGANQAYVAAFILDDDCNDGYCINNATDSSFDISNWTYGSNVTYSSVFLENVDQTTLTGADACSTAYSTDISTSSLSADKGDMVIAAAACSTEGTYTMKNGFTKAFELGNPPTVGYDGLGGYKSAGSAVTLGTWWKLAEASESASHQFSWSGNRPAYGWIMRFTGHDWADPIGLHSDANDSDDEPNSPSVITDASNYLILRLGAFDNGDITVYPPDVFFVPSGHFPITMDRSVPIIFPPDDIKEGFETSFNNWNDNGFTDWDRATDQEHSGSYSARGRRGDSNLTSDNINTSAYNSFVVSFWYRDRHVNSGEARLWFYNGTSYINVFDLGNDTEEQWNYYSITVTDTQYCRSNFRIRFDATGLFNNSQYLWVDDVAVYGSGGVSGGAGYKPQDSPGASGESKFSLNAANAARMVTVAVKPGALCDEDCCGETIKP